MTTYIKTLCADGRSPHQSHPWPLPTQLPDGTWEPGAWVTSRHIARRKTPLTPSQVDVCSPAVYACRPDQLPRWIDARAWYVELDGPVEGQDKVGARAGRLLRPVEGWTDDALRRFAFECADRAVRVHAVAALRSAGLTTEADRLAALPPITDEKAAAAAYTASYAAADAAYAAAYAAVRAAASTAASTAAHAAATYATLAADAAYAAEREWQARRLAELVGLEEA